MYTLILKKRLFIPTAASHLPPPWLIHLPTLELSLPNILIIKIITYIPNRYKVVRVIPKTQEQVEFLINLPEQFLDFWTEPGLHRYN